MNKKLEKAKVFMKKNWKKFVVGGVAIVGGAFAIKSIRSRRPSDDLAKALAPFKGDPKQPLTPHIVNAANRCNWITMAYDGYSDMTTKITSDITNTLNTEMSNTKDFVYTVKDALLFIDVKPKA